MGEFLCRHFNIEDGRKKKQHFGHLMLYYFKKGKNATEMQKKDLCSIWRRCCDWWNVSKVVCEVSCWRSLAGRCSTVGYPNQIETLIENNQRYTMWKIADILKISKSSTENHLHQLGYVNHFDVWLPHKLSKKTFLTIFPPAILYLNVMKTFHF